MTDLLLFAIPGLFIILGALIVIFARNPVHNAMGLVLTLTSLAILYISLNATFVAMVQMLVYAGAVMTLFLFVIMMIGVDKPEQTKEEIKGQKLLISGTLIFFSFSCCFYCFRKWIKLEFVISSISKYIRRYTITFSICNVYVMGLSLRSYINTSDRCYNCSISFSL